MIPSGNNHSQIYYQRGLVALNSVGGILTLFWGVNKCLLALNFILSSADKLLQVDDSELCKLVLIQAAVLIALFKGGEAMLVVGT